MRKAKLIEDKTYATEINRLRSLGGFPSNERELFRALRRISETDQVLIHRVVSEALDGMIMCPSPSGLLALAARMRAGATSAFGRAECPHCHGSGFISGMKHVKVSGGLEYDADFARPCSCGRQR